MLQTSSDRGVKRRETAETFCTAAVEQVEAKEEQFLGGKFVVVAFPNGLVFWGCYLFTPQVLLPHVCPQSLAQVSASIGEGCSHVVGHVDRVQLVCQEGVSQMHPLLLSSGVDGDHPRVHNDHHPNDEVVLFQDHVGDEGHQVQGFLLRATKLRHHHQEVGPCKHSTAEREKHPAQAEFSFLCNCEATS